jgi:uncharacterized protein YndB with AHSA1/START domain
MNMSSEAVSKATGMGWDEWFALLDEAGAVEWDHRRMVAFLAESGLEKPWWQQMVSSTYERARGLKEVGETADAGFQVGVQRTIPVPAEELWAFLSSPEGLAIWLGELERLPEERGEPYRTADGTSGELRSVQPGARWRLTWQPPELGDPTTLQVTLSCPRNTRERTTLRFHHEKLSDSEHREAMRAHWKRVAAELEGAVNKTLGDP